MFRFICGRGGAGESSVPPCQTKVPVPPQNEQKLTPLSCPGTTGRHAEKKVREYGSNAVFPQYLDLFYYFFVKRIRRERDGALIP